MKKFLLIYHSPKESMEKYSSMTEDDVQKVMDMWMKWKEKHGDAIVDFGNPVGKQYVVSPTGSQEKEDDVTGYGLIQAENLEDAKKVLENHPSLADNDGSTVSLYEVHKM